MGLEHTNGAFSCIAEMNIGQDKLAVYIPNVFHGPLILFTGFIVQDFYINDLITILKPGHDLVVCEDFM